MSYACSGGDLEVVKLLLKSCKSFSRKENPLFEFSAANRVLLEDQKRGLLSAHKNEHHDIVDLLIEKLKSFPVSKMFLARFWLPEPLKSSTLSGQEKMVSVLIKHVGHLDPNNKDIWEAMSGAAANGHIGTLRIMLDSFSPSVQEVLSMQGENAAIRLHRRLQRCLIGAVNNGHHDMASLLVNAGALPVLRSEQGDSAFEITIKKADIRTLISLLGKQVTLTKTNPHSRMSNELTSALNSIPPNPLIIDTIIAFETQAAAQQGTHSDKIQFDLMCDKIHALLVKHRSAELGKQGLHKATIALLCTEFGFYYPVAENIASIVEDISAIFPVTADANATPSPEQLRAAITEAIASSPFLHDLNNWNTQTLAQLYASHDQAPDKAVSLVRAAAPQAGLLTAVAEAESDAHQQALIGFFGKLSPASTSSQIQLFMQRSGWHPLVVTVVTEAWDSLKQNKTQQDLFQAIQQKLRSFELAEEIEGQTEAGHHLLIMQLNRLSEIIGM